MDILVKCAQCEKLVIINKKDIDCKIFIHGILKSNGEQIDPHLNKEEYDRLFKENLILGCGKPFRLLVDEKEDKYGTEKCEYIYN